MIRMNIYVKTRPYKLREFIQTLDSLLVEFRQTRGNLCYLYKQNNTDDNSFDIRADWQSWEDLEDHFRNNNFDVLLGAIRLLCQEPEVKIADGFRVMGMEAIEKARAGKITD